MPPLTCPPPEPDCPLYEQRAISPEETLRRAILMERHRSLPGLAALIRAEAAAQPSAPARPALPPASAPVPLSILNHLKGVVPHE